MINQVVSKLIVKVALIVLSLLISSISINNICGFDYYGAIGCILIYVNSAYPLLIVWFIQFIAFNRAMKKRFDVFYLLLHSIVISSLFSLYSDSQIVKEVILIDIIFLYFLAAIVIATFFTTEKLGLMKENLEKTSFQDQFKKVWSRKLLNSAYLIWSICAIYQYKTYYYILFYPSVSFDSMSNSYSSIIPIPLITLSVYFIYKKKKLAYFALFLTLTFSIIDSINDLFVFSDSLFIMFGLFANGYLLFASLLDFIKRRKDSIVEKTHYINGYKT